MENYLYLLEIFVDQVEFSDAAMEPNSMQLMVSAEVTKFVKIDIYSVKNVTNDVEASKVKFNCGKSNLFASTPQEMLKRLAENPLLLSVFFKEQLLGKAVVPWQSQFPDMINKSKKNFGIAGPAIMEGTYELTDAGKKNIGNIKTTVKLFAFGDNLQTSFQRVSDEENICLIKSVRNPTVFQCQVYDGDESMSEVYPLAPLFEQEVNFDEKDTLSFMALFNNRELNPNPSTAPEEFNAAISSIFGNMAQMRTTSGMTFDIMSIVDRPDENKFMDIRIKPCSRGFVFEFDASEFPSEDGGVSSIFPGMKNDDELTAENINKRLCKNKDCPAARKFKEYGIGPLATGKGLGTVYGSNNTPPVTYGMSQTYGVLDDYGPYGLFSRPKRPEEPFIPRNDNDWTEKCWKPKRKRTLDKKSACCKDHKPLRLTGGGVLDYDDVKSPFHECKAIMAQFDEVLDKYKRAIGPCGKVTCPFAPNIVRETCKNVCQHPMDFKLEECPLSKESSSPPPAPKKYRGAQLKGACGSPKCSYAKYKTGLTDEDAMMELQYLPPAASGKCGHRKCPFPIEPELPPIHWDCPDPLPQGPCKNPNCPYLPADLKCLNAMAAKKGSSTPCGNPGCPYALPESCSSPNCPFSSKECPYEVKDQPEINEICNNPACPYAPGNTDGCQMEQDDLCDNPACPYAPKETNDACDDSTCPYAPKKTTNDICDNPQCLFATPPPPPSNGLCNNPQCPFATQVSKKSSACENPSCPFGINKKPSPCYPPPKDETTCDNPTCPFALNQKPSPCYPPPSDNTCTVPNCPLGANAMNPCLQNLLAYCMPAFPICGDAKCPYAARELLQICFGGPTCPFVQQGAAGSDRTSMGIKKTEGGDADLLACEVCHGDDDATRAQGNKKYRTSLALDQPPNVGVDRVEYSSDTRTDIDTTPCTRQTCKYKSDSPPYDKVCREDDNASSSQGDKKYRANLTLDQPPNVDIGRVEYSSDTRTDIDTTPCSPQTCKYKGGDLACSGPCGGGGSGDQDDADVEDGPHLSGPKKYRASLTLDEPIVSVGRAEYSSDTRTEIDTTPCKKTTCKSTGGVLVCTECPCGSDMKSKSDTGPGKKKIQKAKTRSAPRLGEAKGKRRSKSKYVYSIGDKYPGVQIGHKECVIPSFNVPRKMGWLWNIHTPCMQLKPRRGWRPGAVGRTMAAAIQKHREKQGLKLLELPKFKKGRKGYPGYESATSINVQPKPTLQIKKKDGCYWITMNPLKDPHTLVENENPYMDCTPMQFKIVKNKDKLALADGEDGYRTCYCGDDEDGASHASSSSSESELDIEFTPPAGIIHPERFQRKKNVVHCDTQYFTSDFEPAKPPGSTKGKKGKKGKKDKKGKKGKGKGKKK